MSKYAETVHADTPRLVIKYDVVNGKQQFQWGVVGTIPMLDLIGAMVRVQVEMVSSPYVETCPEPALVIAWDEANRRLDCFVGTDIPNDPLVAMLELVKTMLVATHMAQQRAMQTPILGPNGMPIWR